MNKDEMFVIFVLISIFLFGVVVGLFAVRVMMWFQDKYDD